MNKMVNAVCAAAMSFVMLGTAASAATYPMTESVAVPDRTMHFEYPAVNNNVEISQNPGETLVYEFDLKVDDNVRTTVAYYGGSSLGPSFIFDANDPNYDGQVVVKYAYGQDMVEINGNHAYAYYNVGATAHVLIETTVTETGLGDSTIVVTPATEADREYFLQTKDETVVERHPSNIQEGGRTINGRNLQEKKLATVKYTAEFESTVTDRTVTSVFANATLYVKGVPDTAVGEMTFDKEVLTSGETVSAKVSVTNNTAFGIPLDMTIALYDAEGALKGVTTANNEAIAGADTECTVSYTLPEIKEGDYLKAFLWNSLADMEPISSAVILGK